MRCRGGGKRGRGGGGGGWGRGGGGGWGGGGGGRGGGRGRGEKVDEQKLGWGVGGRKDAGKDNTVGKMKGRWEKGGEYTKAVYLV